MKEKINRASQFMSFDALKGLQEELRKREELHSRIAPKELDEYTQGEISDALIRISNGDKISVVFYFNGHYVNLIGKVVEKNAVQKYVLVDETKIFFADIYSIEIIEKA